MQIQRRDPLGLLSSNSFSHLQTVNSHRVLYSIKQARRKGQHGRVSVIRMENERILNGKCKTSPDNSGFQEKKILILTLVLTCMFCFSTPKCVVQECDTRAEKYSYCYWVPACLRWDSRSREHYCNSTRMTHLQTPIL